MGQKIYESDKFLKTGGTSSQYLMADGTTSTGGVDVGTGTANKVAKFSDSDTITDGIMTDDGTSVLVGGNLAIGTGDNDNLFHIEATDNTYDVSRAMEIDYTKSHTGTGWSASAFGIRANIYADGTGKNSDIQGGSFSANHIGSGVSYYLLGSQSNAKHEGSGNTGAIWGAFNRGLISGTGTGTHPYLIGTNQKAELNNANASVGKMQAIVAYTKTTAGDITERVVAAELGLDCNQGATTAVDAAVLYLTADVSNLTTSGTARTINSVSTLPSVFLGSIQAPTFYLGSTSSYIRSNAGDTELYAEAGLTIESADGVLIEISDVIDISGGGDLVSDGSISGASIIKSGGTSSQFLKADGSVDSTVYTGDQDLSGYATETYVGTQIGNLVDSSPSTLNTLNELAAALGDDPSFATTITNSIATKLPLTGGVLSGALKITDAINTGSPILDLHNSTNGESVDIRFTDVAAGTSQFGNITYRHQDSKSYGSAAGFTIGSGETTTTILADGKLMYNEGIYSKPATGTGAGTRKDSNWDAAFTHSTSTHAPTNAEQNVQADWNATSGDALILNKPTIPSLTNYVTTNTTQTISGAKLFNNDVALNQTDLLAVATGYFSQISIGATSPTALFHIIDNTEQSKVRIGSDTSNYLSIDVAGDGDSVISAVGSGFLPPDINFNTNSTTVLKVSGTLGYVGIGTVTPSERLEVNGNVQAETLIATDITNGYVPYSQSGTLGLQDSEIYQSGTGRVGIGTTTLSQALNVNGDVLATGYRVSAMQTAPSSRSDTGTLGEIRITADYIYVCYATDSWRRVAISAW